MVTAILFSCLGGRDRALIEERERRGPLADMVSHLVHELGHREVRVMVVRDDYALKGVEEEDAYREALEKLVPEASLTVTFERETWKRRPFDFGEISKKLGTRAATLVNAHPGARLYLNYSSGFPQLGTVMFLLQLLHFPDAVVLQGDTDSGRVDVATFPIDPMDRAITEERRRIQKQIQLKESLGTDLVFQTHQDVLKNMVGEIKNYASFAYPIALLGETGTGKELLARIYHKAFCDATGRNAPFVSVNCACLDPHRAHSDLFGHKKSAFTGADRDHDGYFSQAHRGVLFLDEFADLPPAVQPMLLRAIQEREIVPLKATKPERVEVALVVATCRPLEELVRRDLFFRVQKRCFTVPPLRDRPKDIPVLAQHFLETECKKHKARFKEGCAKKSFTQDALQLLSKYHWPGNVRELANLICALIVDLRDAAVITAENVLARLPRTGPPRRIDLHEKSLHEFAVELVDALYCIADVELKLDRAAELFGSIEPQSLKRRIGRFLDKAGSVEEWAEAHFPLARAPETQESQPAPRTSDDGQSLSLG